MPGSIYYRDLHLSQACLNSVMNQMIYSTENSIQAFFFFGCRPNPLKSLSLLTLTAHVGRSRGLSSIPLPNAYEFAGVTAYLALFASNHI